MGSEVFELTGNTALYDVLGVTKDAPDKEIRKAYYRLAVVYHPDKNPDGEEIFKEVTFAYNILSDPEQRRMYDNRSLKNHLQGRAREYNPEMDPNVELSQEDLRRFVEKLRQQQRSKNEQFSEFEARREEEMKRRAEYDAKNPEFKREYERQRALRQHGAASQQARAAKEREANQLAAPASLTFRTSAEMMKDLQDEERRRMMGERIASPTKRSAKLLNIKESMMSRYRSEKDSPGASSTASRALTRTPGSSDTSRTLPDFVRQHQHQQVSAYSTNVDETLEKFANYDYLDVVVKAKDDKVAMDGAILADALSQYDRNN
eukprot:gene1499-886_t